MIIYLAFLFYKTSKLAIEVDMLSQVTAMWYPWLFYLIIAFFTRGFWDQEKWESTGGIVAVSCVATILWNIVWFLFIEGMKTKSIDLMKPLNDETSRTFFIVKNMGVKKFEVTRQVALNALLIWTGFVWIIGHPFLIAFHFLFFTNRLLLPLAPNILYPPKIAEIKIKSE